MSRTTALAGGVAVLAGAWGVLPLLGLPPFSTHMTMHMAVVAVAAPLLAISLVGTRFDPVRAGPGACSPIVASMVELVLVWGWHAPVLHHAARSQLWVQALEQTSFLAAGLFLWTAALGGEPAQRRARAHGGITGLLLTSMHMTLLGALITLSSRALFEHAGPAHPMLSAIHDQQLGGAIMLVMGGVAYAVGALWLTADVLVQRKEQPQ